MVNRSKQKRNISESSPYTRRKSWTIGHSGSNNHRKIGTMWCPGNILSSKERTEAPNNTRYGVYKDHGAENFHRGKPDPEEQGPVQLWTIVSYQWTRSGKIFLRLDDKSPAIHITSSKDLHNLYESHNKPMPVKWSF